MTLLLPLPGLTLGWPMAMGDFICNGVSKRQLDTFDLPPITACMGMGLYGVQGGASWDCV